MYDAVADEYCYPGTTVLKNKLDFMVRLWPGLFRGLLKIKSAVPSATG
jgi:hypothetical protein